MEKPVETKIVNGLPPNYDAIRLAVNPPSNAIFCYGNTIYNPSGEEIPEDVIFHERVHTRQQGKGVEEWWNKWLNDKTFRYREELEAYSYQYAFIKRNYPAKATKEALTEMATNLKEIYGLTLGLQETESKIRNIAKNI